MPGRIDTFAIGLTRYVEAYRVQEQTVEQVLFSRANPSANAGQHLGTILVVEHPPVITVSRRAGAAKHVLFSRDELAKRGVDFQETDRGGDVTYHGPGQVVLYPILDLNELNLGLHAYMRLLESAAIDALATWGIRGEQDASATGVWTRVDPFSGAQSATGELAKVCAMGVRVRKWVSMHGLALNVNCDMTHFDLLVPCGLAGRKVTSLAQLLPGATPSFKAVADELVSQITRACYRAHETALAARAAAQSPDVPKV